jgi:hypothetical protein
LEGGGLVGVVLDADDLAVPYGQHLPQPPLVGRVALLITPGGANAEDDPVAGLDGLAQVGPDPMAVLAAEGLQDLPAVVAVPPARLGGEPFHLGVEQVDDGVDAVTAGALVGGLEQGEGSAHGILQRVVGWLTGWWRRPAVG